MAEYKNPTPVAVLLVPVKMGEHTTRLLTVKRNIDPKIGMLALPGGYVNEGESIEIAAARELKEETGLDVEPAHVGILYSRITPDNKLLVFCDTPEFAADDIQDKFKLNDEVSAFRFVNSNAKNIAFPLHAEAIDFYFDNL